MVECPTFNGKGFGSNPYASKKQTKKYYNNLDYKVNWNNYDLVFKLKIIQLKSKEKIKRLKQFWFLTLKKFFSNRL